MEKFTDFNGKITPPANGANRNDGNRNITKNIDFLQHLFSDVNENSYLWLTSFSKYPDRNNKSESNLCWGGSSIDGDSIESLPSRFLSASKNNFFCTSSFKNINGKENRQEDNFIACHMILLDDIGVKVDAASIPLKPTYRVETSPGNFQYGYILSDPITNVEDLKIIVKILADRGMTDAGGACFNKYGRLPVGVNSKPHHVEANGGEWVQKFSPEFFMEKVSLFKFLQSFDIDLKKERQDIFDKKYNTKILPPDKRHPQQVKIRFKATEEQDKQLIDIITSSPYFITYRDNFIIDMKCPWASSHTTGDQTGETTYFLPSPAFPNGGFKCFHGHCDGKNLGDLRRFFGNDTKILPINKFVKIQENSKANQVIHKQKKICEEFEPLPREVLDCPGLVGEVFNWMLDTAPHPIPEAALGASLALCSTVASRRYQRIGDYETRPNIYVAPLATTGRGKNVYLSKINTCLSKCGLNDYIGGKIKSGQGIESSMSKGSEPIKLYAIDEFGKLCLKVFSPRAQNWEKEIENVILEMYSKSSGIYIGGEFSDSGSREKKERIDLIEPSLTIYATSTPGPFFSALSSESISGGFLNRFIVLQDFSKRGLKRRFIQASDPSESIIKTIAEINEVDESNGNLQGYNGSSMKCKNVRETKEATDFLIEKEMEVNGIMDKLESRGLADIWGRHEENTIKLSLIRAIGINNVNPLITVKDVMWAEKIVSWSLNNLTSRCGSEVSDNRIQKSINKIKEIIQTSKSGVLRGDIMSKAGLNKREFDELIAVLIEKDLVSEVPTNVGKRGKPGKKYIYSE